MLFFLNGHMGVKWSNFSIPRAPVQGTVLCLIPDAQCEFRKYNELLASCQLSLWATRLASLAVAPLNPQHTNPSTFMSSASGGGPIGVKDAQRKILEVCGGGAGTCNRAGAPPEFLVLLLEAGRFATYVGLMKVEGWSIAEALGRRNCAQPRRGTPFHRPPPFPQDRGFPSTWRVNGPTLNGRPGADRAYDLH